MKKVAIFVAGTLLFSFLFCGCQANLINLDYILNNVFADNTGDTTTIESDTTIEENNVDTTDIKRAVMYIKLGELDIALSICQSMDDETRKEGVTAILECILVELDFYLNSDNWTSTELTLVDSIAIDKLKKYQEILSLLPLEDSSTNANTFISTALQLEKYTEWNDYYMADDVYLTEIMEYMNQGAVYRGSSWSTAVTYYEKAYTIADNVYNYFKEGNSKGMSEAAGWYKALSEQIKKTINKESITSSEEAEYNHASAEYKQMITEYTIALTEMIAILKSFPNELY